jgi:hypothetical protein
MLCGFRFAISWFCVATLLAAAAAANATEAAPAVETAALDYGLPRAIGPLQFVGEKSFDDPRLGKAFSYRADGFSLDVYIYPGDGVETSNGVEGRGTRNEYEAARSTVLATEAYEKRSLTSESRTRLGEDDTAPEALEAQFDLTLRGDRLRSFLWVTAANGQFFKARFSMRSEFDLEAGPAREQVMAEIGAVVSSALRAPPRVAQPANGAHGYTIVFDSQLDEDEMSFWLTYLVARVSFGQKHGLPEPDASAARAPSFEEEVFARATAVRVFAESLSPTKRKRLAKRFRYYGELQRVIDAGYLREYVWHELRQPAWTAAPLELRSDAYLAWRKLHLPDHVVVTHGAIRLSAAAR